MCVWSHILVWASPPGRDTHAKMRSMHLFYRMEEPLDVGGNLPLVILSLMPLTSNETFLF